MKKFLNSYTGRYMIFGLCLLLAVIGISMVEAHFRINVTIDNTAVTAESNRYNLKVQYDLIESLELVGMPGKGEHIDGKDETSIIYGVWSNDTWGEYTVLAIPNATNCIVLHLTDGRTFVFNARSNEYTAEIYGQLQAHLSK